MSFCITVYDIPHRSEFLDAIAADQLLSPTVLHVLQVHVAACALVELLYHFVLCVPQVHLAACAVYERLHPIVSHLPQA